jgi:hypothetical protein
MKPVANNLVAVSLWMDNSDRWFFYYSILASRAGLFWYIDNYPTCLSDLKLLSELFFVLNRNYQTKMIIWLDYGPAPTLLYYFKRKTMNVLAWTAASGYRYRYAAHNISLMQTLFLNFQPSVTLQPFQHSHSHYWHSHNLYSTFIASTIHNTACHDILRASASTFTAFATILKLLLTLSRPLVQSLSRPLQALSRPVLALIQHL